MPKQLNTYKITNTQTGEVVTKQAEYLGHAIEELGWNPTICHCEIVPVKPEKPGKKKDKVAIIGNSKVEVPAGGEPVDVDKQCRLCGCTDDNACLEPETGETCHWVEPDLCSACSAQVEASEEEMQSEVEPAADSLEHQIEETSVEEVVNLPAELVEKGRKIAAEDQAKALQEKAAEKALKKEVDGIDVHKPVGDASPSEKKAYKNKQKIEQMALEAEVTFLKMGQLLYNAREQGDWSTLHYESFKEYIEDLQLPMTNSYSWATRLSNIYEYMVKNMGLDEKMLAGIGVAKLTRLLPLARAGILTEAIIDAAKVLSDLDLRAELGHDVGGSGSETDMVICPRCGEQFDAKKANRVR